MSELSGTLDGVGLPAIVRFLARLRKTGRLSVQHEAWRGELYFESGELRNAILGSHRGLPALDAMVQSLPGGSFTFEGDADQPAISDVDLSAEALDRHLDELLVREAEAPRLPALDAVAFLVEQPGTAATDDPLPLDRATLQTLLAVDGQHTVREIIAQRGSFDALWQLGNLVDVGLVRLSGTATSAPASVPPSPIEPAAAVPAIAPTGVPLVGLPTFDAPSEPARCPRLGFEDDPTSSFGRPTRLHRCFAAGTPLPLSLDQQRELCISDQFGTCPRLSMASAGPPETPETDDPRIVRLPVGGRHAAASRDAVAERQAVGGSDPSRFRANGAPARDVRPTPLRSRQERASASPPPRETVAEAVPSQPLPRGQTLVDPIDAQRVVGVPVQTLAAGLVVIIVLTAIAFLLAPHVGDIFSDAPSDVDLSALPNSSALVSGTPVSRLPSVRSTPAARPTSAPAAAPEPSDGRGASGASAANAPAQPTLPPEPNPTPAPSAAPADSAAGATGVLDERFANNGRNWPSSAQGTAVMATGNYQMMPRSAGQFVAVGAPITNVLHDVIVSATFHKVSGPQGGGYGIIVRDQAATPQNGTAQNGRYYVLEAGDRGEVGIWRRDGDHWVDLLPWQKAEEVKTGTATNDLMVRAIGNRLALSVNGSEVASRTDNALTSGGVGLFVGGDGNRVAVDRFTVQTP